NASLQVLRVDSFRPAIAQFLLSGSSSEIQPGLIEICAELVGSRHPNQHRRCVCDQSETLLAFPYRVFSLVTLGSVSNKKGEEVPAPRFNLRDGRFYREFFASGTQSPQCTQVAQSTIRDSAFARAADTGAVFSAEAFRNETLNGIPHYFICRAAEHVLRGSVEQHDPLSIIDSDDRVHRRLNDALQNVCVQRPLQVLIHARG